jgi:hypothetical protein
MCILEGTQIDAEIDDIGHVELPVQPGSVFFVPPGATETAINPTGEHFREILIELKQSSGNDVEFTMANAPEPTSLAAHGDPGGAVPGDRERGPA